MSDRSKWPPVVGEQFVQAWINLAELPGGMMRSYSPELGHFRYGPIPGTTSCGITTNPDDAQWWREQGQPVMEIYAAAGVAGLDGVSDEALAAEALRRANGSPDLLAKLKAAGLHTEGQGE